MTTSKGHSFPGETAGSTALGRAERKATIVGSLLGGLVGGGVVYQTRPVQLLYYGGLAGSAGSVSRSWGVWLVVTFLLGMVFVRFLRPRDESAGYLWRSTRRGLFFGLATGLVVGAVMVPALVNATIRYPLSVPHLDPVVLVGVTPFGGIVGAGYGATADEDGLAGGAGQTKAVVFGSLLGGMLGGLAIHHLAHPAQVQLYGAPFGVGGSIARSWAVWLALSLVFGAVFARIVSRSIDGYVATVARATETNPDHRALLGPLVERAPLTTTAAGTGAAYGLALGLVVGLVVAPMLVTMSTSFVYPYPSTNLAVLFGYVVYGTFLGAGYGAMLEF